MTGPDDVIRPRRHLVGRLPLPGAPDDRRPPG
jgi:hypothetical protein